MINTATLKTFRNDFSKAVAQLEKDYNLKLDLGNISYSDEKFTTKLTAISGEHLDTSNLYIEYELAFKENCWKYNMKKTDINRTFVIDGETFKLIGSKLRARKTPIIGKSLRSGKCYRFPSSQVNFS